MSQNVIAIEPVRLPVAHRTVEAGGHALAVRRAGSGPPLVLLHGMPTSSHLWDELAPLLTAEFDVIAVDLLGFGESTTEAGPAEMALERQAELVAHLISGLGLHRPIVCGHDIGGGVAQLLAIRVGVELGGLVLVDSVRGRPWPIGEIRLLPRLEGLLLMQPSRWTAALVERLVDRALRVVPPPPGVERSLEQWRGRAGVRALVRAARSLDPAATDNLGEALGRLDLPVAVVWGAEDIFQAAESGDALSQAIPGAVFAVIPGAGHFLPWDNPAALAEAIRSLNRAHARHSPARPPADSLDERWQSRGGHVLGGEVGNGDTAITGD